MMASKTAAVENAATLSVWAELDVLVSASIFVKWALQEGEASHQAKYLFSAASNVAESVELECKASCVWSTMPSSTNRPTRSG
jgi:hypothetical protein